MDAGALELEIASGPGAFGELVWETFEIRYTGSAGIPESWSLTFTGLAHPQAGVIGRLEAHCSAPETGAWSCKDARLVWDRPGQARLEGRAELAPERALIELNGVRLEVAVDDSGMTLEIEAMPLAWLPEVLLETAGLALLEGSVDLRLEHGEDEWLAAGRVEAAAFDTTDGSLAGEAVDFSFRIGAAGVPQVFEAGLVLEHGELLLGPVYLPSPEHPVELAVAGRFERGGGIVLDQWSLDDPGALRARGQLRIASDDDGMRVAGLVVEGFELQFPGGWDRWLDGWAGARGLGGIETGGELSGRLEYADGGLVRLEFESRDLTIIDPARRFGVTGLASGLEYHAPASRLDMRASWDDAELLAIPLGPSRIEIEAAGPERLELPGGLELPVLDGMFHIDRLVWHDWRGESPRLEFDARLSPLDLATLTRTLDWPELGGSLAGRFPGVEYESGVLRFAGGIDVDVFSGRVRITELSIERPFGTLPALAAQIELERLDLLELTGAFNFGRMYGLLSGYVRDLRLLDWQVAAMDANFYTLDDAPRRRISQRAVENLSSLGGGGAALAGPLFRIFKEFSYRRVGLGCRLSNNICRMSGIEPHESGGYIILEGRGLPRMDIIGHRRLVDWPRLVAQIGVILADE